MNDIILNMMLAYTSLFFGTVLSIWGSQTRGTYSQRISILGGMIWFPTLVYMFFTYGVKKGAIAMLASFILGAICQNIFPKKY